MVMKKHSVFTTVYLTSLWYTTFVYVNCSYFCGNVVDNFQIQNNNLI